MLVDSGLRVHLRWVTCLILVGLSATTLTWAQETSPANSTAKVMVAISEQWEPYQYLDENGQMKGEDIELLDGVLHRIGYEWEVVPDVPVRRLASADDALVHNTLIGSTYTKERAKDFYFSIPYRRERVAIFYRNPAFNHFNSTEDFLRSRYIGATNLNAYFGAEFEAAKANYGERLVHIETAYRRLALLAKGGIDYMVEDILHTQFMIDSLGISGVLMSDFEVEDAGVRFMFRKDSFEPHFIEQFNVELAKTLDNNTWDNNSQ